jgi:hypothetical protein
VLDGPSVACHSSALAVTVSPEARRLAPGGSLDIGMDIAFNGRRPCLIDGGDANKQIDVLDADGNVVWSSAHCPAGARTDMLIGDGDILTRKVRWGGVRSAPDVCTADQPAVSPGVYSIVARVVDTPSAVSDPVTVTLRAPITPQTALSPAPSLSPASDGAGDGTAPDGVTDGGAATGIPAGAPEPSPSPSVEYGGGPDPEANFTGH